MYPAVTMVGGIHDAGSRQERHGLLRVHLAVEQLLLLRGLVIGRCTVAKVLKPHQEVDPHCQRVDVPRGDLGIVTRLNAHFDQLADLAVQEVGAFPLVERGDHRGELVGDVGVPLEPTLVGIHDHIVETATEHLLDLGHREHGGEPYHGLRKCGYVL